MAGGEGGGPTKKNETHCRKCTEAKWSSVRGSKRDDQSIELDRDRRGKGWEEERRNEMDIRAWSNRVRTTRRAGIFERQVWAISYGSAVMRGAFPSVDLFALPILISAKSTSAFSREYEIIETSQRWREKEGEEEKERERERGKDSWSSQKSELRVHTELDENIICLNAGSSSLVFYRRAEVLPRIWTNVLAFIHISCILSNYCTTRRTWLKR